MKRMRQAGFAYIAAIVFLLVLAGFALAALRLSGAEQVTVDQNVLGMRAGQAARGGIEWALYQLGNAPAGAAASACTTTVNNKNLPTDFYATGFRVTLTCTMNAAPYNEGLKADGATPVTKNIYEISATACNGAAQACPDNASVASPDYVERKRSASICIATDGADCY